METLTNKVISRNSIIIVIIHFMSKIRETKLNKIKYNFDMKNDYRFLE